MPLLFGGVAHLARALAWHARGSRFKSDHLHLKTTALKNAVFFCKITQMKKTFALAFSISAIFISSAFAKIELLPTDERPTQWLQFNLGRSAERGIERNKTWTGIEYNFDWQPFGGFIGFQTDTDNFDLTLKTDYLPFAFRSKRGVWRLGAATNWHMQRRPDSYFQHDILEEFEARWLSDKGFAFCARGGYSLRITTFDALQNFKVTQSDIVISMEVDKIWKSGIELFASIGSYSLYRYPLFFCPQWTLGAAFNIKRQIRLAASLDLSMTDFYASVAYFNQIIAKCSVRFIF